LDSLPGASSCSEEVWDVLLEVFGLLGLAFDSVEDFEVAFHIFGDVQDRGYITAAVAVISSRPDSHEVAVLEPVLEAVHDKLMGSSNQVESIDVIELGGDFATKEPTSSTHTHLPGIGSVGGV